MTTPSEAISLANRVYDQKIEELVAAGWQQLDALKLAHKSEDHVSIRLTSAALAGKLIEARMLMTRWMRSDIEMKSAQHRKIQRLARDYMKHRYGAAHEKCKI